MRKSIAVVTLGLALLAAGTAAAKLDADEQNKVDRLAQTLALTAGQKEKLSQEREQDKKQLLVLEKKWQELHDALRREVRRSRVDENKIEDISRALGKIRGEMIALRTRSLVKLKSLLAPEQLERLEQGQPAPTPAESEK